MPIISSIEELRNHFDQPMDGAVKKQLSFIDDHARHFISKSPLLCLASSAREGLADNTPRGDAPGFVAVLDDHHLLIPERPGNNRCDTLENIIENPNIGLLFFLPGVRETFRVNGVAQIIVDDERLEQLAVKDIVPKAGILVEVKEAYFHCGKALIRSRLWDPDLHAERGSFPSLGQIMSDQLKIDGVTGEQIDDVLEENYKSGLY